MNSLPSPLRSHILSLVLYSSHNGLLVLPLIYQAIAVLGPLHLLFHLPACFSPPPPYLLGYLVLNIQIKYRFLPEAFLDHQTTIPIPLRTTHTTPLSSLPCFMLLHRTYYSLIYFLWSPTNKPQKKGIFVYFAMLLPHI